MVAADRDDAREDGRARWTLITNHGACLIYVTKRPEATIREIADAVGITERAAARILRDLREARYIEAKRVGRRNVYQVSPDRPLRHQVSEDAQVTDLLDGLVGADDLKRSTRRLTRRARRP